MTLLEPEIQKRIVAVTDKKCESQYKQHKHDHWLCDCIAYGIHTDIVDVSIVPGFLFFRICHTFCPKFFQPDTMIDRAEYKCNEKHCIRRQEIQKIRVHATHTEVGNDTTDNLEEPHAA